MRLGTFVKTSKTRVWYLTFSHRAAAMRLGTFVKTSKTRVWYFKRGTGGDVCPGAFFRPFLPMTPARNSPQAIGTAIVLDRDGHRQQSRPCGPLSHSRG